MTSIASTATRAEPKSQNVNGHLELSVGVSYRIDNAPGTLSLSVDRLDNLSETLASGAILIKLFLTAAPVPASGAFAYTALGSIPQSPLGPLQFASDLHQTAPLPAGVPDGTYYIHVGAFENEGNAGCVPDGYCLDSVITFPWKVQVAGGVYTTLQTPPAQGATTIAVEYFNAAFGHYFVTADADEIAGLDGGAYNFAFVRTGQTWKVWTTGSALDLCRFFTTPGTFGTRSSHFYTADAAECAGLKANPNWIYEKIAGKVLLPNGGACAAGTIPLYRLYNNGQTGAPNHRYTTSLAIRTQMIGQGFVPEDGNTACVPQ